MDNNGTYIGMDIMIEEMPQGCIITPIVRTGDEKTDYGVIGDGVRVSGMVDAIELVESLERMLKTMYGTVQNDK